MRRAIVIAFGLIMCASPVAAQWQEGSWGDELPPTTPLDLPGPGAPVSAQTLDWPAPPLDRPPVQVRAIYVNAWAFGSSRFWDLIRLADTTEVNSFVIDVKDDTGYLTYRSEVPTAIAIGANGKLRAKDTAARLRALHAHGIHAIARIVVAKDPLLASQKPAWSIRDKDGGLWRDRLNFAWVDAYNDSVWVYAAQLAAEAVRMGFGEVQFDYVRFPDEPRARMARAVFPARRPGETNREGVRRHLALLRDRIRPLGVPFTIDVFGMTTNVEADLGIGQIWEDLVTTADVVLPMVYPSHYYHAMYGVAHPNSAPYRIVQGALEDALRRNERLAGPHGDVRPYLQAFTLGRPRYTPEYVRDQIQAAADLGIHSWVLWNARSVYDARIFAKPHHTVPRDFAAGSLPEASIGHLAAR
ncbi:MAG TPA: putative glycoside hydrolase [Gemmatimonadales bacterium]|nr:putative glycoside hydrolase [Gemmatimonadales bacterium]